MLLYGRAFNHYVVDIDFHGSTYLIDEHLIHQMLVGCSYVFQAERHHPITVLAFLNDKRHVFFVSQIHTNLVIPQKSIHKAEYFVTDKGIHKLVDSMERENILWAGFV